MINSISPSSRQLLALARASLWQQPAEEALFSKERVDWQKIGQLALQQTIGILTLEAALALPSDIRPPKDWIQRAIAFLVANRRTHMIIDGCVAETVSKLRDEGINSVLLKGQAYARAYPNPGMRQCGDIDLYVGGDYYQHAYTATKEFGWESDERFQAKAKHYGCRLRGIRVELHRIACQLPSRSTDRKFQQWSRTQLNKSPEYLVIGGEKVMVPTAVFDVVFVFMHLYLHFLNGGIGLRHICDWTMIMHSHAKEINTQELEQKLKELRLMRAWRIFAPIAVEHLGLPSEECPFYSSKYSGKAERVLSIILKEGNFGRARQKESSRPEGYLAGKLYSFKRNSSCMYSRLPIDPYTISRFYSSYVIKGVTNVLKDLLTKD